MKIFPSSLLRITGAPFDDLETLHINSVLEIEYYNLLIKYEELKQKVIDDLYILIGSLKNTDHQNLLLNLKRDIFNDRFNTAQEISHLLPLISERIQNLILEMVSLKRNLEECESVYVEQTGKLRGQFKKMIQDPTLQKGLLFSSKSLLKRIPSYLEKNPDQFSRNDLKTELGLLKYLTRIKTKTSPFSTFTNLAIAPHNTNSKTIFSLDFDKDETPIVVSHMRLNNAMFVYLRSLLVLHPAIYPWFRVSLNPTICLEEKTYLFLTNHNNIESFQRIPFSPFLGFIRETLDSQNNHPITFQHLTNSLSEYVEASAEELSGYLKQLIDFGFLEFELGVSGLDPDWDVKLRKKLHPLQQKNVSFIAELRQILKELRRAANAVESAGLSERDELLKKAYHRFKSFSMKLHEDAGLPEEERLEESELQNKNRRDKPRQKEENEKSRNQEENGKEKKDEPFRKQNLTRFYFNPETIFYEDTSLKKQMKVDDSKVKGIVQSMDALLRMQPSDGGRWEKQKMVDYFASQYGKGESVALFTFYEDYYRDVKKPDAEKRKRQSVDGKDKDNKSRNQENTHPENDQNNKFSGSSKKTTLVKRWKKKSAALFESADIFQNGIVRLEQRHLEQITVESGIRKKSFERTSFGMFIQLFTVENEAGNEQLKGVVNGAFPGFGRMMSRFLHLFDEKLTEKLRSWNFRLAQDDLLVENCDASCFNANIHPPLMPGEIRMPGSQNTLPVEKQVPITDLFVQEKNGQLFLKNQRNNKIIYTFDLGFQGGKGHSELFQLLSWFTLARFIYPYTLISTINEHVLQQAEKGETKKKKTDVVVYPRIEYDNKLVLQRKHWTVPVSKLPVQKQQESNGSYFLRVNWWRKNYGIPSEVFVTVYERTLVNKPTGSKKQKRVGRDDYKPQYIDFNNPLLVNLFSKLVNKVPESMKIEEMLPRSDQLFKIGNKKFVTEHMIQWYHF